nr:uncharacterized mitochondrial protein AtMg00810-like [Tanacetum cinerariifolium]
MVDGENSQPHVKDTTLMFQCPILTSINYTIWKMHMEVLLGIHRVWDVVDPGSDDAKKNNIVKGLLFQSIPEDLILQIGNLKTGKEMWEAIKTHNDSIDVYAAKLSALEQVLDLKTTGFEDVVGRLKAYEERVTQEKLLYARTDYSNRNSNTNRGRGRGSYSRGHGQGRGRGNSQNQGQCDSSKNYEDNRQKGVTPYVKFYKEKPNLEDLKVFGRVAYERIVSKHLRKLDDRSKPLVYLRKDPSSGGFWLYNPRENKIIISPYVICDEKGGWKWKAESSTQMGKEEDNFTEQPTHDRPQITSTFHATVPSTVHATIPITVHATVPGQNAHLHNPKTPTNEDDFKDDGVVIPVRRSTRNKVLPTRLVDYQLNVHELVLTLDKEPRNYNEAKSKLQWLKAMKTELELIVKNNTLKLVPLPKGVVPIGLQWLFKIKRNADGISLDCINKFKRRMASQFEMSDLAGMEDCNATSFPMEKDLKLSKIEDEPEVEATNIDLTYSVGVVSRYMQSLRKSHARVIKQILRYLKGTTSFGIKYNHSNDIKMVRYSDSSHNLDIDDGQSTTRHVFYLGTSPITRCSQKQTIVALSLCEAEFMAATSAACQAIWLRELLVEVTGLERQKVIIRVDNKSAIALSKNSVFYERSKHIHTRYHFIRECVKNEQVIVEHVSGENQRADTLMKALARIRFKEMISLLGVQELPSSTQKFRGDC